MSHSYSTSTYGADAGLVPAPLESLEQLGPLRNAAWSAQKATPDKLVYLLGDTRSGWAIYTVKRLLDAVDLPSLRFLTDQGQHKFETEHDFTCVSVLEGAELSTVAEDLKKLLALVKETPRLALDADNGGYMDLDLIEQTVARDYVSTRPALDYGNVVGDEGQTADYFFTWLRSVLRVIEVAQADGRAVIHVLEI